MLLRTSIASVACLQLLIATGGFLHVEGKVGFGIGEQEWGYVTVRPYAHMFWWLYYTNAKDVADVHEKPLVIWLQGGPGASSTGYGNFEELGPLDLDLKPRNYTWVNDYNVLFIDNPVGTGYSYTEKFSGYAKNNAQIAADLLECIRGFLNEFPKFATVPIYVTAESYGGKMAAEFALVWYKAQIAGNIKSNLRGVALGDSWISPIDSVLSWGTYLLQTGMVDTNGFERIEKAALETKMVVDNEKWSEATKLWSYTENVIIQVAGNIDFYNILYKTSPSRLKNVMKPILPSARTSRVDRENDKLYMLMNNEVKKALGINVTWSAQSSQVFNTLAGDFMKPVTDQVERLLNETDIEVFVFTGQLDLIVATPGTVAWVENLKWRNSSQWLEADRLLVTVDNVIEGYVKQYGNFKMYWINRAGHMVPKDNPAATAAMLKDLTAK